MSYVRVNWKDDEIGDTPIDAENLNKMDLAISEHETAIATIPDLKYDIIETF